MSALREGGRRPITGTDGAAEVGALFDRSADRYDRINRIITLGQDRGWRRWVVERARPAPGLRTVDVCAGTGIIGIELARRGAQSTLVDVSAGMLDVAQTRARAEGLHVDVQVADVAARDLVGPVDVATMGFGLRYFADPVAALQHIAAALAPEGRFIFVDAVVPPRGLVGRGAGLYFFHVAPQLAVWLGGRRELYDSLTTTVRTLGSAAEVRARLIAAGLHPVVERTWTGGLIYGAVAQRRVAG